MADGLGVEDLPDTAIPMVDPVDLPPSDALPILKNQATTFRRRKLGIMVTDGVDDEMLAAGSKRRAACCKTPCS